MGGREGERRAAEINKPRRDLGIGERGVDFAVQFFHDLCGSAFRAASPFQKLTS